MKWTAWVVMALFPASAVLAQEVTKIRQPDFTLSNVSVQKVRGAKSTRLARIDSDVKRLESILTTAQNAGLQRSSLKSLANEANMLANRIRANVQRAFRGNSDVINAATQLRMHVREMHKAATKGDTAGVQMHAREALPFALRIDDKV
jgi:hypothetical protein